MEKNIHGFEEKQIFLMGGIGWTVIETGKDWIKCIAVKCIGEDAFDKENKSNFANSSICKWLNGEFLRSLIEHGMPEAAFINFAIDLTTDDGLKNYGESKGWIGLITCEEYRRLRGNIPKIPGVSWWTATPDSPENDFVRVINSDGSMDYSDTDYRGLGVRPVCVLKSGILAGIFDDVFAGERCRRAEAVDMVKHIAAAWDIRPGEIFGRG